MTVYLLGYLAFCIAIAIATIIVIYLPLLGKARRLSIKNEFTEHPYSATATFFVSVMVMAPAILIAVFTFNSLYTAAYAGFESAMLSNSDTMM